ncbi:antitoxin [Antribacter gilvus]|uniref:type II toxin-antitoxin system VapB family antitoxin n=1 Tax=Antribacter gilvus TaxID=2304675 RepID=UPI000F77B082|nr:antitoxin [Antribacter gilvus]
MSDILIRDVPDEVVRAIDAQASHLGLSRTEYLRRRLAQDVRRGRGSLSVDDLRRTADAFADALDPDVMDAAWR